MKCLSLLVLICLGVVLPAYAGWQSDHSGLVENDRLQTIPFKQDDTVNEKTLIKVAAVSVFGITMVFVVLGVLKKYQSKLAGGADASERICLQTVKRLSPKLILTIARVDDKEYLIAQSGDRLSIAQHRELEEAQGTRDE